MKKLKLKLDDLEVTSFVAQDRQDQPGTVEGERKGTVAGMELSGYTVCICTFVNCPRTVYCSNYPGQPNNTCYDGCMTNQNGAC